MTPQPVTLTVTVLIDGQHAGSAAQNLIALTEEGALESGILATVRAELATYDALSDWRIVRATVTASQPDDDAGAGADDPPVVDTVALWRHRTSGERYIVELSDGHVVNAAGPVYYADIDAMLDTGDWAGDAELADDIEAHQDDYDDAGAGIEEDDDDDPPTCPACGSTDAAPLGTLGGLHWRRCKSCGIDYSQPQEAPR